MEFAGEAGRTTMHGAKKKAAWALKEEVSGQNGVAGAIFIRTCQLNGASASNFRRWIRNILEKLC
jgi:hypothetical protein